MEGQNQVGSIRFGWSKTDMPNNWYAFATPPGDYWASAGDIWLGKDWYAKDFAKGYEFLSLIHEIGHAL